MIVRPYLAFARIAFLKILAYRLRYYTGIVTYMVNVSVYYFIWKALYRGKESLGEFTFEEMITYVSVGFIIRTFYFNNIDREIANDILLGHIAAKMTRPVNYQWMNIAQAAGESFFRLFMFTVPTALAILLVFPLRAPASLHSALAFVAALLFSFMVFAALNFLVGTCAVYLHSILGLIRAKYFLVEILSGLLIPISFFPDTLAEISRWLPFQLISFTPLMIYMGKFQGEELVTSFLLGLGWTLVLVGLGHWFWRKAATRLTVQGG